MNTMKIVHMLPRALRTGLVVLLVGLVGQAQAVVNGWAGNRTGPSAVTFALAAKHDFVSTSDGNSHYAWGYAHPELPMQYPGPTLVVNQGDTVTVTLTNTLPVPVSIVFPGQRGVTATGGSTVAGQLTREAAAGTPSVPAQGPTYTFVADKAGTFMYHSGTNADLQVEMGLVGALIVRPMGFAYGDAGRDHPNRKAYQNDGTGYDRETLFLLSEMDPAIHWQVYGQVLAGLPVDVDTTSIRPSIWFINGRNAPDTLLDEYVYWLPTQPYNSLPRMHPGERLLMRVVNVGRDLHPFHHHGNHAVPIARDAQVLSSVSGAAPDLTSPDFTVRSVPGQTMDLIYEWTGKNIGWDIYGTTAINPHTCSPDANGYDTTTREWCADHNKPIPVIIPGQLDLSSGENYSGSPYLGMVGILPQGHPGLNTTGGYYHMWHSHNEREITTDDIFPGGMMTMLVIEPWSVSLEGGTGVGGGPGGGGTTSIASAAEFDAGANQANVSFNGTTLAFGVQNGNRSAVVTFTIGGAPATFQTATVTNAPNNGNRFGKGLDTCSGFAGVGQCSITINFNAANNTARTGQLTVPYTGSAGAATITIVLTGQ